MFATMKHPLLLLCFLFSTILAAQSPVDSTFALVFVDEFNGSHVNMKLWDLKAPWNQSANDSMCICDCYSANPVKEQKAYNVWKNDTHNIKISNGTAKIFVRKEDYEGEFWDWEKNPDGTNKFIVSHHNVSVTTALLYSNKQYGMGYYEIRFKLPKAPGLFASYAPFGPNFWLWRGGCWNEIDLFEIDNGQTRNYTTNLHYEYPPTMVGADTICDPLSFASPKHRNDHYNYGTISDDEWHTAGFDWQENQIVFYLDGKEYYRSTQPYIADFKPMNMIVGIASPLGICASMHSMFVKFPYIYEVDYVKVWQRKGED